MFKKSIAHRLNYLPNLFLKQLHAKQIYILKKVDGLSISFSTNVNYIKHICKQ